MANVLPASAGENNEAIPDYRKPPLPVSSPSIMLHRAYWVNRDDTSPANRSAMREKALRTFASSLDNPKTGAKAVAFIPNNTVLGSREYEGRPIQLCLELHHEYVTISASMGLPRDRAGRIIEGDSLVASIRALDVLANDRFQNLDDAKSRVPLADYEIMMQPSYNVIFIEIWEAFIQNILNAPLREIGVVGPPFANFRGFIAASAHKAKVKATDDLFLCLRSLQPERTKPTWNFSASETVQFGHTMLPLMARTRYAKQQVTLPHIENFLKRSYAAPIAETTSNNPTYMERQEITITSFLDRRCIYASTLGAQDSNWDGSRGQEPLTYVMLTSNINSWQRGRLVDRVHLLGTVRLAALRDLADLRQAGDDLHNLELGILADIRTEAPGMISDSSTLQEREKSISSVSSKLSGVLLKIYDIRDKSKCSGGLPYRVERSRYYRKQFNELLPGLRISRIEGFQPYDRFTRRRFDSAYNFINMVGMRFTRIWEATNAISQQTQAASAVAMQARAAVLADQTATQTRRIERLQEGAERAFFLVPLPYYLGHVFYSLMKVIFTVVPDDLLEMLCVLAAFNVGLSFIAKEKERSRLKYVFVSLVGQILYIGAVLTKYIQGTSLVIVFTIMLVAAISGSFWTYRVLRENRVGRI